MTLAARTLSHGPLGTIPDALERFPFLTERWLRILREERRVTTYKAAGRVLFDLDEIERMIANTREGPR